MFHREHIFPLTCFKFKIPGKKNQVKKEGKALLKYSTKNATKYKIQSKITTLLKTINIITQPKTKFTMNIFYLFHISES